MSRLTGKRPVRRLFFADTERPFIEVSMVASALRITANEPLEAIPMCTQEHLDELRKAANEGRYSDIPNPLTAPEAAAIARRSRATIMRACRSGQLKASNTGTRWNVNRDSLLAYAGLI